MILKSLKEKCLARKESQQKRTSQYLYWTLNCHVPNYFSLPHDTDFINQGRDGPYMYVIGMSQLCSYPSVSYITVKTVMYFLPFLFSVIWCILLLMKFVEFIFIW